MHSGASGGSDATVDVISREDVDQFSISADVADYRPVRAEAVSGSSIKSRPLFSLHEDDVSRAGSAQAAATVTSAKPRTLSVPQGFDGTSPERCLLYTSDAADE